MKRLFIIANWKANKTSLEAQEWLQEISNLKLQISNEKELIICPAFQLLTTVKDQISQYGLRMEVGVQDVSAFASGAHTGEVAAEFAKEFATYVIIGHSERREQQQESDELLAKKVAVALSSGLQTIYCVRGLEDVIPMGVTIAAYEPVSAIGSGQADSPESAQQVAEQIKQKYPHVQFVLYGGSVTAENVSSYTSQAAIDGVLVGGASLDAVSFADIIKNS